MLKLNFLVAVAAGLVSWGANAADYRCEGADRADRSKKVEIGLKGIDAKSLILADEEGSDIELNRNLREKESSYKYAVYADMGYDGYGGFIKVSIPQKVSGGKTPATFVVYYLKKIYSELGHVATVDVHATCGRHSGG